jgi:hypothetical protein
MMKTQTAFDRAWEATMDTTTVALAHAVTPPGYQVRRVWRWATVLRVGRLVIRKRRRLV